jgi:uncharacterized protein
LKTENHYIIAFKELSEGSHDFVFNVGKPFIEEHEFLEARDGNLKVNVLLLKMATCLNFTISIHGSLEVQCDRCLDFFPLEIDFHGDLYAKFSENSGESDDDVILLNPDEDEVDLKQYIYESIGLSIPYRKIHPAGSNGLPDCNKEMLAKMNEHLANEENVDNPMWDKLKDLL